jgi:hypothetical protein
MKLGAAANLVADGFPSKISDDRAAMFKVGDRIRTRNINPAGHTRCRDMCVAGKASPAWEGATRTS